MLFIVLLVLISCSNSDSTQSSWTTSVKGTLISEEEPLELAGLATTLTAAVIEGVPPNYRIILYDDANCQNVIRSEFSSNTSMVDLNYNLSLGDNPIYMRVITDINDRRINEQYCLLLTTYYMVNIEQFNLISGEGVVKIDWLLDKPISVVGKLSIDHETPILIERLQELRGLSLTNHDFTLILTDNDNFSKQVYGNASPMVVSKPQLTLLREDGQEFKSNPGFSNKGITNIRGVNSGETISVYRDSECNGVPVYEAVATNTYIEFPAHFIFGPNVFYVKRVVNSEVFSCSESAAYIRSLDVPEITVGNSNGNYLQVNLTLVANIGGDFIYELAHKKEGENFGAWIEGISGVNELKVSMGRNLYKARIKDEDGKFSSEIYSSEFLEDYPCSIIEQGEWVYIPIINDSIGVGLQNRLLNFNGAGVGVTQNDRVNNGFCIMKYESKNINEIPTSFKDDMPWIYADLTAARNACKSLGTGFDLPTHAQWMMMLLNIEAQDENWYKYIDNTPSTRGDSDSYVNSGNVAGILLDNLNEFTGINKRTHKVKNGFSGKDIIWDISGNLKEWLLWNRFIVELSPFQTLIHDASGEWSLGMGDGSIMIKRNSIPQTVLDTTLNDPSSVNLGRYIHSNSKGSLLAGGSFLGGTGIFDLDLTKTYDYLNYDIGFRCTYSFTD